MFFGYNIRVFLNVTVFKINRAVTKLGLVTPANKSPLKTNLIVPTFDVIVLSLRLISLNCV